MQLPASLAGARSLLRGALVPNWQDVLRLAWSVRLMIVAALLSGIEVALPYLDGLLPIPPGLFALGSLLTTAAAFVARFVAQQSLAPAAAAEPDWEDGDPE